MNGAPWERKKKGIAVKKGESLKGEGVNSTKGSQSWKREKVTGGGETCPQDGGGS